MADRDVPPDGVPPEEALELYLDTALVAQYIELKAEGYDGPQLIILGAPLSEGEQKQFRYRTLRTHMQAELIRRLQTGELVGSGYDGRAPFDAPAVHIPLHRWRALKLDFDRAEATDGDLRLTGLRIAPAKVGPVQAATAGGEQQCREWLADQMRTGQRPKQKAHVKEEALVRFPISARGFERAWSRAIEETGRHDWSKPGRKS